MARRITKSEVAQHNTPEDCWLIIDAKVYDVTKWAAEHPGGPDLLWDVAGKDATRDFEDAAHSDVATTQLESLLVGILDIDVGHAPHTAVAARPPAVSVTAPSPAPVPVLVAAVPGPAQKKEFQPSYTPSGLPVGLHLQEDEALIGAEDKPAGAGQRKKVPFLGPGFSHMDWMRLTAASRDLAGTHGNIMKVTRQELQKHNKLDDAWMVLRGKVYNITPYMKFHPGGVDELMRAAGKDGTKLFDFKHSWVNAEAMLLKCFVGYFVGDAP